MKVINEIMLTIHILQYRPDIWFVINHTKFPNNDLSKDKRNYFKSNKRLNVLEFC